MAMVFYDTETTGTNTSFDQILQFAAIYTDSEFKEIDRIEMRSRLQPHIVPAPGAVRATGVSVAQLTDTGLPSYYEMVRAVRSKLLSWSPAIFIGFNSIRFDEHLLRQALYQTLHDPYLTNKNRNTRTDALNMVQAASIYAPNSVSVPLDGKGKGMFKLEHLAPANGIAHRNAHDAMGDVEATLAMCRLIMDQAPDVWSAFMRFSQKKSVISHLEEEPVCSLSGVYFGKPYSYLVAPLGANAENSAEFYVFDLGIDAVELRGLSDEDLIARLRQRPKPVRVVKCNGAPILMPVDEAPEHTPSLDLGWEEIKRRAHALRGDTAFCDRLMSVFELTREAHEPSVHVEEQIYDGFAKPADEKRMEAFHEAPWEERSAIVESFDDPRLIRLGRRLVGFERPDLLDEAVRQEMGLAVARRIAKPDEGAPWLCLTKAIAETKAMIAEAADEAERELLESLRGYLADRMDRELALLG